MNHVDRITRPYANRFASKRSKVEVLRDYMSRLLSQREEVESAIRKTEDELAAAELEAASLWDSAYVVTGPVATIAPDGDTKFINHGEKS